MTTQEIEDQIVEEFAVFDDWLDKYEYLIELGKGMPVAVEADKTDDNLIKGCQSRVWLETKFTDGKLWFTADSDAIITKGMISLLVRVFNGQSPESILSAKLDFIDTIGLRENLSPTRAGGLVAMIERIRHDAAVYMNK